MKYKLTKNKKGVFGKVLFQIQAGLIEPSEVSENWGLLWYDNEKQRVINKKRAPALEMNAERKLQVLLYFLNNGSNHKRPLLQENNNLVPDQFIARK